jgi:signal transduction histidine kinase/PAS domain-containing protein
MVPIRYVRVNNNILEDLTHSLLQGDSSVLIGPRFCGKRSAMRLLETALEKLDTTAVMIDLLTPPIPASERELSARLLAAAPAGPPGDESLDAALDRFSGRTILFLSNLDAMPQQISQMVMQKIEQRIEEGRITVLVTGETDLRDLLGGTKGLDVHYYFFVQGFDRELFDEQLSFYAGRHNVEFTDESASRRILFEATGGNVQLLRSLFDVMTLGGGHGWEIPVRHGDRERLYLTPQQVLDATKHPPDVGLLIFRNATRHLWQDPTCCEDLEALLNDPEGRVLEDMGDSPRTLEVAGVVVREGDAVDAPTLGQRGRLRFSSPMFESFMRTHYDDINLGDLYAQAGNWEMAAKRYSRAPREQRIRPRSSDDRVLVDLIVRSLCFSLHLRATEDHALELVDKLFTIGCKWLLGFEEVSWFHLKAGLNAEPVWSTGECDLGVEHAAFVLETLRDSKLEPGEVAVPKKLGDAVGLALDEQGDFELSVVILSDTKYGARISPVRSGMVKRVIEHFVKARDHAVKVDARSRRLQILASYREIYNHINDALGTRKLPIDEVLEFVADKVMPLGYRVFGCAHYDRERQKMIPGIYCEGQSRSRIWGPEVSEQHLQVAQEEKPRAFPDANGREILVLPIFARSFDGGSVNGGRLTQLTHTLAVQREDYQTLTHEERSDLVDFGEQLMMAVRHGERITLVESALDQIREPVAIVDPEFRLRYANKAMREVFPDSPSGWEDREHSREVKEVIEGSRADRMIEMFTETLRSREIRNLTEQIHVDDDDGAPPSSASDSGLGLGRNKDYEDYYGRIHIGNIMNSRGRVIGSSAHIRDLRDQLTIFRSVSLLFAATSEDTVHGLLLLYDRPSTSWRRLYRVAPDNRDLLIGAGAIGSGRVESEREFSAGNVTIERSARTAPAFLCFERRVPVVFQAAPRTSRTKYGVPIEPVPDPPWIDLLKKEPGEMWLDVPLGGGAIGKVSMQCDDEVRPEQIEYWRILGDAAGIALKNLQRETEGLSNAALAAERVFLAAMAHNLHTRISSLYTVQDRYENYATQHPSPKLLEINAMFDRFLGNIKVVMDRVKEQLGVITLIRAKVDVVALLKETFEQKEPRVNARIAGPATYEIEADRGYLSDVISEMLQNAVDAAPNSRKVEVGVRIEEFLSAGCPWTRIVLSDQGRGVEQKFKSRIFELFFTHRENGSVGTGIGLYFCRRVIQAHGGTIVENGTPGQGARFVIEIPKRDVNRR